MAQLYMISRNRDLPDKLREALGEAPSLSLETGQDYPSSGDWDLLLPEIQSLTDWILCLGQLEHEGTPLLPICTEAMLTEIVRSGLPLMDYLALPLDSHVSRQIAARLRQEYPDTDAPMDSRLQDLWRRAAWGSLPAGTGYIRRLCDHLGISPDQRSALPLYVSVKEIHTSDETPERMRQVADLLSFRLRTIEPEACRQIVFLSPTEFLALFRFPEGPDFTRLRTCGEALVDFSRRVLCCTVCCYVGQQTDISRIRTMVTAMIRENLDNIVSRPLTIVREQPPEPSSPSDVSFAAQQWARFLYADQFEAIVSDVQNSLSELDARGQLHRDTLEKLAQEFSQFLFITLHDYGLQASQFFDTTVYRRLYHLAPKSVDHTMKWIRYTVDQIAGHFRQEYANTDPVSRVVSYIDTHLVEDLRADVLAEIAHYSPSYLGRAFRKQIGMTFQEYIRLMRMRFAENLLLSTDLNVGQIAERVGYRSYASFHTQFRRHYGCSPTDYRRRMRASGDTQPSLEGS